MLPTEREKFGIDDLPADAAFRKALANAIKASRRRRSKIAEEMSSILGFAVTEHMLNECTRLRDTSLRFPAAWVPAFCEAARSDELQRFIMGRRLRSLVRLGELELERRELRHLGKKGTTRR